MLSPGTNDVGAANLLTGQAMPSVTIVDLISCTLEWIKILYSIGARHFLFQNVGIGCSVENAARSLRLGFPRWSLWNRLCYIQPIHIQ